MAKNSTKQAANVLKLSGYKGLHRAGSIKGDVHKMLDDRGAEAAFKFGERKGIKQASLRTWLGAWRREAEAMKAAKSKARGKNGKAAKARARKAAPKAAPQASTAA